MRRGCSDAPLLLVDIEDSDSGTSSTSGSGRQTPEISSEGKRTHRNGLKPEKSKELSGNVCSRCIRTIFSMLCLRNVGQKIVMVARSAKKLCDLRNLFVLNVLVLLINLFFLVMQINKGFWPVETYFQPVLTAEDKDVMMTTMKKFVSTLLSHNITVFMYGGTLIGSYRHHGFIPWDDDVDLIVNGSEKNKIIDVLSSLEPEFRLYTGDENLNKLNIVQDAWKFYSDRTATKFVHKAFKWPYIDIFFFTENETHVLDECLGDSKYVFPKSKVFPLVKRPFMGSFFPAPCDTKAILDHNYEIELCRSRSYSHMMEVPMFTFSTKDVPCKRLQNYFPFVERNLHNGYVNETLRMSDWTLGSLSMPISQCRNMG